LTPSDGVYEPFLLPYTTQASFTRTTSGSTVTETWVFAVWYMLSSFKPNQNALMSFDMKWVNQYVQSKHIVPKCPPGVVHCLY
jgi:hypothetical protein